MSIVLKLSAAAAVAALLVGSASAGDYQTRTYGKDKVSLFVAAGSAAYGDVDYKTHGNYQNGQAGFTGIGGSYGQPQVKEETAIAVGGAIILGKAQGNASAAVKADWDANATANSKKSAPASSGSSYDTRTTSNPGGNPNGNPGGGSSGCGCGGATASAKGGVSASISSGSHGQAGVN